MATSEIKPPPSYSSDHHNLRSETLPLIDLRLLSQSELQFLSLSSPSSAALSLSSLSSDIVLPSIDRSVFNESAGSRKQTYSRLRLAPRGSNLASVDVNSKIPRLNRSEKETDTDEDRNIVELIRSLFDTDDVDNSSVDRVGNGDSVPESSNVVLQAVADNCSVDRLVSVRVDVGDSGTESSSVVLQPVIVDVGSDSGERPKVKIDSDMILDGNGIGGVKSVETEGLDRQIANNNRVVVVCGLGKMDNDMILGEKRGGVKSKNLVNKLKVKKKGGRKPKVKKTANDMILGENEGVKTLESGDFGKEMVNKNDIDVLCDLGEGVKKKGRKRKVKIDNDMILGNNGGVKNEDLDRDIVNKNGVVVDFSALAKMEDPYGDELRRKTEGLVTKEDFWGVLGELVGQWGSKHKKRRIVAASDFGDALPKGWKLILFIKKKGVICRLICRQYISPSGREFVSCKEISSYLLSLCRPQDANALDLSDDNNHLALGISGSDMQQTSSHTCNENNITDNRTTPTSATSLSTSYGKETPFTLLKYHNQGEAQVKGASKCPMCTMSFVERDDFLHHNFSSHKKTGKKRKQGTCISDGVIIKDGIFECQFCHKTFNEKHRYNSHVGIHMKNFVKNLETSKSTDLVSASGDLPIVTGMQFIILSSTDASPIPYGTVKDCPDSGSHLNNLKSGSASESCIKEYNNEPHFLPQIRHDMVNDKSSEPHVNKIKIDNKQRKVSGSASIDADQMNLVSALQTTLSTDQSNNLWEKFDEHTLPKHTVKSDGFGIEEQTIDFGIYSVRPAEDTENRYEQDRCSEKGPPFLPFKHQSVVDNLGASVSVDTSVLPSTMHSVVDVHALNSIEKRKGFGNCLFLQPRNEQICAVNNNFVDACNNSLEGRNQVGLPESRLFNPSFNQQNNGVKKLLTFRENSKSDETRNFWSNELVIGSGDSQTRLDVNRNFEGHSSQYSGSENLFGVQNNVNAIDDNVVQEQRQESGFRSSLFGHIGNDQLFDIENNSKNIYTGAEWGGDKLRTLNYSRNNEMMIDFGSSLGRPVVSESVCKKDEEIIMQSGLPNASVLAESSSCFTGFDFISDKNENELFSGNAKFDGVSGFGGVQSTSMEQMEYNFFTPQTNPENSKVLSYDADIEQAFDSYPWHGQETMLSKTASRNQPFTSVCVWCGNEFHHEAFNSGTQTGSIGYICPTCKEKM